MEHFKSQGLLRLLHTEISAQPKEPVSMTRLHGIKACFSSSSSLSCNLPEWTPHLHDKGRLLSWPQNQESRHSKVQGSKNIRIQASSCWAGHRRFILLPPYRWCVFLNLRLHYMFLHIRIQYRYLLQITKIPLITFHLSFNTTLGYNYAANNGTPPSTTLNSYYSQYCPFSSSAQWSMLHIVFYSKYAGPF